MEERENVNNAIFELKMQQALTNQKCETIEEMLRDFIKKADEQLLTKSEFEAKHWPIRTIVYGIAAAVGMAVITAILTKVVV